MVLIILRDCFPHQAIKPNSNHTNSIKKTGLTRVDNFYYYGSLKITVNHYFRKDVVMDMDEQLNEMEIYKHKAIHKIILGCIQEKKSFTETDISIYFSCINDYQKQEIFKNLNILIDSKFIIEDKDKQMSLTEEGEKYLNS
jgi:hypothetical protein